MYRGMVVLLLLLLVGCGKSSQTKFIEGSETFTKESQNGFDYELKLTDFSMPAEETGNAYASMIANQLKDISIDGSFQQETDKNFRLLMNLQLFGQTLPIEAVGNEEATYLSTDYLPSILDLMNSFGVPIPVDEDKLNEIAGKYVDLETAQATYQSSDEEADQDALQTKELTAFTTDYQKQVKDYLASLPEDSFEEKEDKITHVFDEKEIMKVIDLWNETADSKDEYKDFSMPEDTTESLKEIKAFQVKMVYDTKKNTWKNQIKVTTGEEDSSEVSITMQMNLMPLAKKEAIKLPTKDQLVTSEEMEQIFPKEAASSSGVTITDEEFSELLDEIKENRAEITDEMKDTYLTQLKPYLTEAQYKQLEEVLQ